jgi:hypothetical protein
MFRYVDRKAGHCKEGVETSSSKTEAPRSPVLVVG